MEDQVQSSLIVKTFPVGPLQCNCTLIGNPQSGQAILIDPGGDSEMLLQELSEHQLQLVEILHTHAHLDHFLASGKIKEATGAKTHCIKMIRFSGTCWKINAACSVFPMNPRPRLIIGLSMRRKPCFRDAACTPRGTLWVQ